MDTHPVHLAAWDCVTAFGNAVQTHAALLAGKRALSMQPVGGTAGGDLVPLALIPGRSLDESIPPAWMATLKGLVASCPDGPWGDPKHPVFVTSSNFGVGSLFAYRRYAGEGHLGFGTPEACVGYLRGLFGWGENITIISHACVSSNLGLLLASRQLAAGIAEEALVFTFDFLSPFVAGGFNALKILNSEFPAPYSIREIGSIGLGDGAAYAVLRKGGADWVIAGQTVYNEMHHFTAFPADGSGFSATIDPLIRLAEGRRVWVKGHGTGTLDAGRLEAEAFSRAFPGRPLVGWKGSLGHTLGSNGLVESTVALEALRSGRIPGTVGSSRPAYSDTVAIEPIVDSSYDGVLCASNAFGGAHAGLLVCHA